MKEHPTKWLIAIGLSAILALGGWGLNAISADRERITRTETKVESVDKRLERIEDKIDRLLSR